MDNSSKDSLNQLKQEFKLINYLLNKLNFSSQLDDGNLEQFELKYPEQVYIPIDEVKNDFNPLKLNEISETLARLKDKAVISQIWTDPFNRMNSLRPDLYKEGAYCVEIYPYNIALFHEKTKNEILNFKTIKTKKKTDLKDALYLELPNLFKVFKRERVVLYLGKNKDAFNSKYEFRQKTISFELVLYVAEKYKKNKPKYPNSIFVTLSELESHLKTNNIVVSSKFLDKGRKGVKDLYFNLKDKVPFTDNEFKYGPANNGEYGLFFYF